MWTHTMLDNNNELLLKALRLFVDDKIDPEALKIMLRDVFEIMPTKIGASTSTDLVCCEVPDPWLA